MASFQDTIRHFMKENNLSDEELAHEMGVSTKTISRYKNGRSMPKASTLSKMARIFRCSSDELLANDTSSQAKEQHKQYARKPTATDREFSYFEGITLYIYYIKEGNSHDIYEGCVKFDNKYDSKRLYLHGHASTGHEYDVKLVIEDHHNIFFYGISNEDERRFHIALFYPDYRGEEDYTSGVGVLTRLDAQNVIVAQRVVLSDRKINLDEMETKQCLFGFLSDGEKVPRIWVNARIDNEFRTGKWHEN